MTTHHPDYASALEQMAANLRDTLGTLNARLKDRTAALGRVQKERDALREALLRVIALPAAEKIDPPILTRDEVHDAIGHDVIAWLTYADFAVRWIAGLEPDAKLEWRDPTPRSLEEQAKALEALRSTGIVPEGVDIFDPLAPVGSRPVDKFTVVEPAKFGRFAPWPTEELKPYLAAIDKAVKEIAELCDVPEYAVAVDRCPKCGSLERSRRDMTSEPTEDIFNRIEICNNDAWHLR